MHKLLAMSAINTEGTADRLPVQPAYISHSDVRRHHTWPNEVSVCVCVSFLLHVSLHLTRREHVASCMLTSIRVNFHHKHVAQGHQRQPTNPWRGEVLNQEPSLGYILLTFVSINQPLGTLLCKNKNSWDQEWRKVLRKGTNDDFTGCWLISDS